MAINEDAFFYAIDDERYKKNISFTLNKRAKRLGLRVDHKTRKIKLTVPYGARLHHAVDFVERHENWILKQLNNFPESTPFTSGTTIPLFGKERVITCHAPREGQHKRTTIIELQDNSIDVFTNRTDPSGNIKKWIKNEALATLSNLSHEKAAQINKVVHSVNVRDTSSRWGSCSHDGRLSYSWRLIFAPFDVIDYVAAHEVAHLQHLDHSKNFWTLCEQLSDDMAFGRKWLKENGNSLLHYG